MDEQDWFHVAEWQLGDGSKVVRRTIALLERHAASQHCVTGALAAAAWSEARFGRDFTFEVAPAARDAVVDAARGEFLVSEHFDGAFTLRDDGSKVHVSVTVGPRPAKGVHAAVFGMRVRVLDVAGTMADRLEAYTRTTGIPRLTAAHHILAVAESHPEFESTVPPALRNWATP